MFDNYQRYERHLKLTGFEKKHQDIIQNTDIAVVGIGGVGNIIAYYLVAAGLRKIKIIDFDVIEMSNLNRQFLYKKKDIGKYKVDVAKRELKKINEYVNVESVCKKISDKNADKLFDNIDLIVEAVDNFDTRRILSKISVIKDIPFVHAGVQGCQGQILSVLPKHTACFDCIFPNLKNSKRKFFPIWGMAAGHTATIAASEALKIITNWGKPLYNKLWIFDLKNCISRLIDIERRKDCEVCGD